MILKNASAITPGKAILFGEHFVVYGYSSIIFAIDKKFKVTISLDELNKKEFYNKKKVKIFSNLGFNAEINDSKINLSHKLPINYDIVNKLDKLIEYLINDKFVNFSDDLKEELILNIYSEIPIGGGLGSSSALCVSLLGAFYDVMHKKFNKEILSKKSIELEKIINPNTSGVDCNICTFGGLGAYNKSLGFKKLNYDINNLSFLIINTGINHNTFEMVNKVKKFKENNVAVFNNLCKDYERIFNCSLKALQNKDLRMLGILMNENHLLLKTLNLSNSIIDKIVKMCQSGGTFGTKITGAGGGGCILSLINYDEQYLVNKLLVELDDLQLNHFFVNLDDHGFRLE
jgi:mevalonate kinase